MNALALVNAPPPRLSSLLGQVASIATITSSSLGLNRLDKQASAESDRAHNAQQGVGRNTPCRFPGEGEDRVKALNKKAAEIGNELKSLTTDWDGARLLANTILPVWLPIWAREKKAHADMVASLIDDAPRLIAEAEYKKGSYNVEVPTLEEIESAFKIEFTMKQIPDASTYRSSGLDTAMEEEMRRRFEAGIEAAYTNATTDAMRRVAKPLGLMVERLTSYTGAKGERLYDSVIGNVQDIAKVFGSFNLTGDPIMDRVAKQLHAFDGIDAEALKGSDALRKHVTKTAEEILRDLVDLI